MNITKSKIATCGIFIPLKESYVFKMSAASLRLNLGLRKGLFQESANIRKQYGARFFGCRHGFALVEQ